MTEEQYLDTWTKDRNHAVELPKPGFLDRLQWLISGLDATKCALIPDVSHWNYPCDVARMVKEGNIDGLIIKASDGHQVRPGPINDDQTYLDDRCPEYVDLAYRAQKPAVLYHYVQWNIQPNWITKDIIDFQVDKFCKAAKNKTFAGIALDIEETNTTSSNAGLIASEIHRKLGLLFPTKKMWIYSRISIYNLFEHLLTWVGTPEAKDKYNLWMAQWTWMQSCTTSWAYLRSNILPALDMRVMTPGNATWKMVQWTGDKIKLPGCSGAIELNLFKGTPEEWYKFLDYTPPVIPPDPEPLPGKRMRITCDTLNIRSGPGTAYKDIGDLHAGDIVEILDVGGGNAWIQTDKGWCCVQLSKTRFMEPV